MKHTINSQNITCTFYYVDSSGRQNTTVTLTGSDAYAKGPFIGTIVGCNYNIEITNLSGYGFQVAFSFTCGNISYSKTVIVSDIVNSSHAYDLIFYVSSALSAS